MQRFVWLLSLLTVLSCADQTGIVVVVDGSALNVPDDIDALRFVITGQTSGRTADFNTAIDGSWPQSLAIRPGDAGNDERIGIRVLGVRGGLVRMQRFIEATFRDGTTLEVDVRLEAACLDVMCPETVDCRAGACVDAPADAGTDAGADAGVDAVADVPVPLDGGPDAQDAGDDAGVDGDVDAGDDAGMDAGPTGTATLMISEYVEGSSFNKAIELYNATDGDFALAGCTLTLTTSCGGGATTPYELSGTLPAGGTFVLCNSRISDATACDDLPSVQVINHNGDDIYSLSCGGTTLDTFGSTVLPCSSSAWANQTLRRRANTADTDLDDAFDPSAEWDIFPSDTLDGLGSR